MLREVLWGVAVPIGPGTPASYVGQQLLKGPASPASGDGESYAGGGKCSRWACGGQQLPTAPAHQPGEMWSLAQVLVGAQGGPAAVATPNGPGTPAWRDGESCPGGGRCCRRASGG